MKTRQEKLMKEAQELVVQEASITQSEQKEVLDKADLESAQELIKQGASAIQPKIMKVIEKEDLDKAQEMIAQERSNVEPSCKEAATLPFVGYGGVKPKTPLVPYVDSPSSSNDWIEESSPDLIPPQERTNTEKVEITLTQEPVEVERDESLTQTSKIDHSSLPQEPHKPAETKGVINGHTLPEDQALHQVVTHEYHRVLSWQQWRTSHLETLVERLNNMWEEERVRDELARLNRNDPSASTSYKPHRDPNPSSSNDVGNSDEDEDNGDEDESDQNDPNQKDQDADNDHSDDEHYTGGNDKDDHDGDDQNDNDSNHGDDHNARNTMIVNSNSRSNDSDSKEQQHEPSNSGLARKNILQMLMMVN
ncbi:PREDICTED: protein starmaker-like [Ipomoea nil]|uniref:protein starmaker-like n=1 Tax=Ipomoea nil TaxID=35883 RepID=UPI000900E43F|nr:PREDICTED: protein starmaker-like [Ipomoea nil]